MKYCGSQTLANKMVDIKIKDIESETFILSLLTILFLILPGITIIFLYKPELFQQLDWIKLLLFSISITLPFTLINILNILNLIFFNDTKKENDLFFIFSISVIITGIILYIFFGISYLFNIQLKHTYIALSISEFIVTILIYKKAIKP